jgi:hypothetical protein
MEDPVKHAVARQDAQLRGATARDLQYAQHQTAGRQRRLVVRTRVAGDRKDLPVGLDKDDVQRDQGVLHPIGRWLRSLVDEEHSPVGRERFTEHQTPSLLGSSRRDLDLEARTAATGNDLDRLQLWRRQGPTARADAQRQPSQQGPPVDHPFRHAPPR